jgi:transposase-like protein
VYTPLFCPHAACTNHLHPVGRWWSRDGFHETKAFGIVRRFVCKQCGKSFSVQTFSVHYYAKRRIDLVQLERLSCSGMSLRALSRHLGCTCDTVQNRIDRLSRQGVALHAALRIRADHHEDVCFDGFVSFDRSQYFPNDIGISISSRSRFVLGLTHATTRRAGAMREAQKERRDLLYRGLAFERKAVERSFAQHLDRLARERAPLPRRPLVIITDEKAEYRRAFARHALFVDQDGDHRAVHATVSSKQPRTVRNPLFASNYFDREIRKDRADQRRETTCFARDGANGLSRLSVYAVYHNYAKRFLIKARKGEERTHAEVAGIERTLVEEGRKEFFGMRAFLTRLALDGMDEAIWKKAIYRPERGKVAGGRLPQFALA